MPDQIEKNILEAINTSPTGWFKKPENPEDDWYVISEKKIMKDASTMTHDHIKKSHSENDMIKRLHKTHSSNSTKNIIGITMMSINFEKTRTTC